MYKAKEHIQENKDICQHRQSTSRPDKRQRLSYTNDKDDYRKQLTGLDNKNISSFKAH